MPPKGSAKGKAKAKAAGPAAGAMGTSLYGTCDANTEILSKHQLLVNDALALLMRQAGCADLLTRAGASPAQAPFNSDMFKAAMAPAGAGYYRCGGNALWASASSGPVGVNANKLEELINWGFPRPAPVFPETVIIGVFLGNKGPKPTDVGVRGSLLRISPEEPLHAWILAASRAVRDGASEEDLEAWVGMVMAAPLEFRRIPDQNAVFWAQVAEREALGRRFTAMFRTPSGRILEIVAFAEQESKRLRRPLSRGEVTAEWKLHFDHSQQSEEVTFSTVDAAMKIHAGILRNPVAAKIVFSCEDPALYPQNPWTIHKLVEVVRKATVANAVDPTRVAELLEGVNFRVRSASMEPGENTVKGLSGRGQSGNRGLLDLLLLQFNLRNHFLNDTLAALTTSADSKATLRKALSSIAAFETECQGDNLAWIGVLEPAAQLFQKLVQDACFSCVMDPRLRRAGVAMQGIPEMLTETPFAERIEEIVEAASPAVSAARAAAPAAPCNDKKDCGPGPDDDTDAHEVALCHNLGNNAADEDKLKVFKSLPQSTKTALKEYELEARRLVEIGCQLLVDCQTASELANNMRTTERLKLHGSDMDGYCLFAYVPRVAGESSTAAATRLPPLRSNPTNLGGNHIRKLLSAAMMSRVPVGENYQIHPGDLFVIADSGRCESDSDPLGPIPFLFCRPSGRVVFKDLILKICIKILFLCVYF